VNGKGRVEWWANHPFELIDEKILELSKKFWVSGFFQVRLPLGEVVRVMKQVSKDSFLNFSCCLNRGCLKY
jgi:hypothetical protein